MLDKISEWVGRSVKIVDGIDGTIGEQGIVLAVDDTPYRPSAWVKVRPDCDYPAYRSCDLCWLQDEATEEYGPVWGEGGPEASIAALKQRHRL
jgi:hypothetical protein